MTNEHIISLAGISLIFGTLIAVDFIRTPRRERCLWVSVVHQIALMVGLMVGEIFVTMTGSIGLLLRIGILAAVFIPTFLVTHWFRKRGHHVA